MSKGPLALVGSGEFTDSMLNIDQFLLKQIKNYFNEKQIKKMESNYPEINIVGIDEDTAYINMEGKWSVLGKGQVHDPISGEF